MELLQTYGELNAVFYKTKHKLHFQLPSINLNIDNISVPQIHQCIIVLVKNVDTLPSYIKRD